MPYNAAGPAKLGLGRGLAALLLGDWGLGSNPRLDKPQDPNILSQHLSPSRETRFGIYFRQPRLFLNYTLSFQITWRLAT